MPRFLLTRIIPLTVALLAPAASTFAQAPAPGPASGAAVNGQLDSRAVKLSQLYNGGMQFFEGQKYDEAIQKLEEFLGMLTEEEKQKTPLTYLVLGECYYRKGTANSKVDKEVLEKGIAAYWKEFIRRWPADPRVIEVKVAIAQTYLTMKQRGDFH